MMSHCSWISIDAEIVDEKRVCLFSLSFPTPQEAGNPPVAGGSALTTIVVDCIPLHPWITTLLGPILAEEKILKLIFSCGSLDASSFYSSFGLVMCNVIDLQIMHSAISPQVENRQLIGLIDVLTEAYADDDQDQFHQGRISHHATLKTRYQNSDWALRPLVRDQVVYSGLDVMRLHAILFHLSSRLVTGDPMPAQTEHIIDSVVRRSHKDASRLLVRNQGLPFEYSRLFCAAQRNLLAGEGFGRLLNVRHMKDISRLLTWRHVMTCKFGLQDDDIVSNDEIMSTVLLSTEVEVSQLLVRLNNLLAEGNTAD